MFPLSCPGFTASGVGSGAGGWGGTETRDTTRLDQLCGQFSEEIRFANPLFANPHFANQTKIVQFRSHFANVPVLFLGILSVSVNWSVGRSVGFSHSPALLLAEPRFVGQASAALVTGPDL